MDKDKSKYNELIDKYSDIIDFVKTFAIVFIVVSILRLFVFNMTRVSGHSMDDTLTEKDLLFVDKIGTNFIDYERGDIVILEAPDYPDRLYVKRIIGLPGEKVDLIDGSFYINNKKLEESYTNSTYTYNDEKTGADSWTLENDEYFVVGDNRLKGISNDSRAFGPIKKDSLQGRVIYRIYPFDNIDDLREARLGLSLFFAL